MNQQDDAVHVDSDRARAGSTPHVVRWMLGISLLLAVVAMSFAWIIPALTQGDEVQDETRVVPALNDTDTTMRAD